MLQELKKQSLKRVLPGVIVLALLAAVCMALGGAGVVNLVKGPDWLYDYYGEDRTVDTHVKMLRSHLGKYRDNIVTVWGIGYKFDPDVRPGK